MTVLRILILCLITTVLFGCSAEEDFPTPVEPPVNPSDNVYHEQNQWIYAQMNQHYLWREDLPDSIVATTIKLLTNSLQVFLAIKTGFLTC